jgi:ATP-dependent protease ClpP protease subunit
MNEWNFFSDISYWDIDLGGFREFINQATEEPLIININSYGGDAMLGIAIANIIRSSENSTVANIWGIAASAASVIAVACDHVVMQPSATLMIHDAWTWDAGGTISELDSTREQLDQLSNQIADIYVSKAGGSREQWRELMGAETFYTGQAAVEAGLADEVVAGDAGDGAENKSLRKIVNMHKRAFVAKLRGQNNAVDADDGTENEDAMELKDQLIKILELDEAATDDDIIEAVQKLVDDSGDKEETPNGGEAAPSENSLPKGMVAVDEYTLSELRKSADALNKMREEARRTEVVNLVDEAINSGRISANGKDAWVNSLLHDFEGGKVLLENLTQSTPVKRAAVRGYENKGKSHSLRSGLKVRQIF